MGMVEYSLYEGTGWHWNTEKSSWRHRDAGDSGQGLGNEGDTTLRGEKGHGLRDGGKRQWDRGTKRGFKNFVLIPASSHFWAQFDLLNIHFHLFSFILFCLHMLISGKSIKITSF